MELIHDAEKSFESLDEVPMKRPSGSDAKWASHWGAWIEVLLHSQGIGGVDLTENIQNSRVEGYYIYVSAAELSIPGIHLMSYVVKSWHCLSPVPMDLSGWQFHLRLLSGHG